MQESLNSGDYADFPEDDFNKIRKTVIASGGILRAPPSFDLLNPANMNKSETLAYLEYLERSHIFCSGENQFPGFRRVVLLGSVFNYGYDFVDHVCLIAIRQDGRLFTGMIHREENHEAGFMNIMASPEDVLAERNGWKIRISPSSGFYFFLNQQELNSDLRDFGFDKIMAIMPQSDITLKDTARKLKEDIEITLNQVREILCNSIDRKLLHHMDKAGMFMTFHANWLTGGDNAPADVIQARCQAIESYPLFAREFFNNAVFREAIDARTSLSEAFAHVYGVDQRKVRRLQGLTRQECETFFYGINRLKFHNETKKRVVEYCTLPECAIPDTPEKFRMIEVFGQFSWDLYYEGIVEFMNRVSKNGDPWSISSEIEKTNGSNIRDAVEFLVKKLYFPAALNNVKRKVEKEGLIWNQEQKNFGIAKNTLVKEILSSFTVKELLVWSERYHNNIIRYEDLLEVVSMECTWSGMLGQIDFGDGIIARELTSSQDLKKQGRKEKHCVGGYVSRIVDGNQYSDHDRTIIFSIENQDKILGTVEIIVGAKPKESTTGEELPALNVRVGQNMAYHNSSPCAVSRDIAERIALKTMEAGPDVFAAYLDGLKQARAEREASSRIDEYIIECGFNPWNRESLERVWKEFSPGLSRSVRRSGLDKLIDRISIGWSCTKHLSVNLWDQIDQNQYSLINPNYAENAEGAENVEGVENRENLMEIRDPEPA